jgi:peptidylprolyl isomerase
MASGGSCIRWSGVLLLVALGACGDDYNPQVIEQTTFAESLGVSLAAMTRLQSGVYIQDITVGTGNQLALGGIGTVTYTLWLSDGTLVGTGPYTFETEDDGDPNTPGTLTGFLHGVLGMYVGGERLMLVPPGLGYGDVEQALIPAGSILVFRVELTDASGG